MLVSALVLLKLIINLTHGFVSNGWLSSSFSLRVWSGHFRVFQNAETVSELLGKLPGFRSARKSQPGFSGISMAQQNEIVAFEFERLCPTE